MPGEEAEREAEADDDHAEHVRHAREEEERDAAPRDPPGVHAAAFERPCAEREAAGAAGRQHGVGAELGEADLGAQTPAHAAAEDGAEDEHVGEPREDLQHAAEHEPSGARVRELRAQAVEAGGERDHGRDERDHQAEREQPPADVLAAERGGRVELSAKDLGGGAAAHRCAQPLAPYRRSVWHDLPSQLVVCTTIASRARNSCAVPVTRAG